MTAMKMATNIKIHEDLVPGIKRILDEVSTNRRFLTIDSVWTMNRCIKFRFINNPRTFEIRSYADYHNLFMKSNRVLAEMGKPTQKVYTKILHSFYLKIIFTIFNKNPVFLIKSILTCLYGISMVLEVPRLHLLNKQVVTFLITF